MEKLPWPPEPILLATRRPVYAFTLPPLPEGGAVLWRVHSTEGAHPSAWNQMRSWGPAPTCRFDPHEPPPHEQAEKVLYAALDVPTALAEVFHEQRRVIRDVGAPFLSGFAVTRSLRLLDLTGDWPLRVGAAHAINGDSDKAKTRAWARAFRLAYPDADGLLSLSSLTGRQMVTLFAPAEEALPAAPAFSEPLASGALLDRLRVVAKSIGYTVL
ncbi:RES family NAD+ phosphorylase [Nocardioides pakistanensis]